MARTPGLLHFSIVSALLAGPGCASWHYRKENHDDTPAVRVSSPGELMQSAVQGLSYDSLHDWSRSGRW